MATRDSISAGPVPDWQREYESALRENDHKALFKRVEVAEAAIRTRREVLEQSADGFVERAELDRALANLRVLKKKILNFDDSKDPSTP